MIVAVDPVLGRSPIELNVGRGFKAAWPGSLPAGPW